MNMSFYKFMMYFALAMPLLICYGLLFWRYKSWSPNEKAIFILVGTSLTIFASVISIFLMFYRV